MLVLILWQVMGKFAQKWSLSWHIYLIPQNKNSDHRRRPRICQQETCDLITIRGKFSLKEAGCFHLSLLTENWCATQWLYPVKCNLFFSLFHYQGCYFKLYSSSEGSYGRGFP